MFSRRKEKASIEARLVQLTPEFLKPTLRPVYRWYLRTRRTSRDIKNRIQYGSDAPVLAERVWVDPQDCTMALPSDGRIILMELWGRQASARVVTSSWPREHAVPTTDSVKIRACIEHWEKHVPWEDTGVYEHMESLISERGEADGCSSADDVVRRCFLGIRGPSIESLH